VNEEEVRTLLVRVQPPPSRVDLAAVLEVDREEWAAEIPLIEAWFDKIGDRLPTGLRDELETLKRRLGVA